MAAVIARALCVTPCKVMGKACDGICNAIGACCDGVNQCIANTCGKCFTDCGQCLDRCCQRFCSQECVDKLCSPCSNFFSKPFSSCVLFTFIFAFAPAMVIFAVVGPALGHDCNVVTGTDKRIWALVQGGVFLAHFVMSIYVLCRFSRPYDLNDPNDRNFSRRIAHALCEDVGFALYICVALFAFIWNVLGNVWNTSCPDSDASVTTVIALANTAGWIYFVVGGLAFLLGSCTAGMAEGACTDSCPYLCVCCGQALCGDACCPRSEEERRADQARAAGVGSHNIVINANGYQAPPAQVMSRPVQQQQQPAIIQGHVQSVHVPVATARPVHQPEPVVHAAPQVIVHGSGPSRPTRPNDASQAEDDQSLGSAAWQAGAAVGNLGIKGLKIGFGAVTGAAKSANERRKSRQ